MLVAFGENDIKNTEDLAGCVSDDLLGYIETKDNERVRVPGALDGFDVNAEEANALIMNARVRAGWITAEDLLPPEEEVEDDDAENDDGNEAPAQGTE
jgi:N utilization substance protein A